MVRYTSVIKPMDKLEIFKTACDLAETYHHGQTYEVEGDYYDNHLLTVSTSSIRFAPPWLAPLDVQTVGVLHDILEDTDCDVDILLSNEIPAYIVDAVLNVTKRRDETEASYFARVKSNPLSLAVKLADSHENLTNSLIARNKSRVVKYTRYLNIMIG